MNIFFAVLICCVVIVSILINSIVTKIRNLESRVEDLGEAIGTLSESIDMTDELLSKLEEYLDVEYYEEGVSEYRKVK